MDTVNKNNTLELDCLDCIWWEYAINNKCVPCRLNKCDCFSMTMYESNIEDLEDEE